MTIHTKPAIARAAAIALAVGAAVAVSAAGQASADVAPGTYTSTTVAGGIVLLQRQGHVEGNQLVLIGRYPIHPTPTGGWIDLFPGHRVILNSDGHGGYTGPAYFGGTIIGSIELSPVH